MQATEKKLNNNRIWMSVLSVGVVIAIILGIVSLVNNGKNEKNAIPTISQQVDNIKNTLPELEAVSTELKGYIDTLETTVEKLQTDLTATNTAIDTLKKDLGDDIDENEQALLDKLTELKTTIEGQLTAITTSLETLAKNDEQLGKNITDLKAYVDTGLQGNKDWANATFSTLEQYEATQTTISEIKLSIAAINTQIADMEANVKAQIDAINGSLSGLDAKIEYEVGNITNAYNTAIDTAKTAIEAAYTVAIKTAVDALETKMIDWVNGELEQPLKDIAALQADLNALISAVATDGELADAVAAQQKALDDAVAALKVEYKKAIENAVANDGVIDKAIAAAVKAAQDASQTEIDSIKTTLADLEYRIEALEELFDQIQSMTFIPAYSDGKVLLDYTAHTVSLDFMINPSRLNTALVAEWENNKGTENSIIKAYVRYTDDPVSRTGSGSVAAPTELTVSNVTASEGGMINITVSDNDTSLLIDDFWNGSKGAVIYIVITNGRTEISSEAIPMIAHNYAGNYNSINGFDDGGSYQGNIS